MKMVYFIRHGQSAGNASLREQQTKDTLLTKAGGRQAKIVAQHMKKLPLEAIVASPFTRTKATAEELSRETGLSIEYSELFVERRRPGVQLRKNKLHPHWLWVQLQLVLFSRFKTYRHSDEETPEDLLARAHAALADLANRPESTIAVVTHGRFMRALYAYMVLGEGVTGRMYLRATRTLQIRNTALMIAQYEKGKWEVRAWNMNATKI